MAKQNSKFKIGFPQILKNFIIIFQNLPKHNSLFYIPINNLKNLSLKVFTKSSLKKFFTIFRFRVLKISMTHKELNFLKLIFDNYLLKI